MKRSTGCVRLITLFAACALFSVATLARDAEMLLDEAKRFADDGNYEAAAAAVERVIDANPEYAYAYFLKARYLYKLDRRGDAIRALDHAAGLYREQIQKLEAELTRGEASQTLQQARNEYNNILMARAHLYFEMGETRKALAGFSQVLINNPNDARALAYKGACYQEIDPKEALAALTEAVRIRPDLPVARYYLARNYMLADKLDLALQEITEAIRHAQNDENYYLFKAEILYHMRRYPETMLAAEYAIRLRQKPRRKDIPFPKAEHLLARALIMTGDFAEAEKIYRTMLTRDPDDVLAVYGVGRTMTLAGKYAPAREYILGEIKKRPAEAELYVAAGINLLIEKNVKAAEPFLLAAELLNKRPDVEEFADAIAKVERSARAYLEAGRVLDGFQLDQAAENAYTEAFKSDPNSVEAGLKLAISQEKSGKFKEALDTVERLLAQADRERNFYYTASDALFKNDPVVRRDLDPSNAQWRLELKRAALLTQTGHTAEAQEILDRQIKAHPDYAPGYHLRGLLRMKNLDRLGALDDFNHAVDGDPENPHVYADRALFWYQSKVHKRALADALKAAAIDPELAAAYRMIGQIYYDLSNYREALTAFERYLALGSAQNEKSEARRAIKMTREKMAAGVDERSEDIYVLLGSESIADRRRAAKLLYLRAENHLIPLMLKALGDADYVVRTHAVRALGKVRHHEGWRSLINQGIKDKHEYVRAEAVRALATYGKLRDVRPIARLLDDPDENVIDSAIQALGKLTDREFGDYARESDPDARRAIVAKWKEYVETVKITESPEPDDSSDTSAAVNSGTTVKEQ